MYSSEQSHCDTILTQVEIQPLSVLNLPGTCAQAQMHQRLGSGSKDLILLEQGSMLLAVSGPGCSLTQRCGG